MIPKHKHPLASEVFVFGIIASRYRATRGPAAYSVTHFLRIFVSSNLRRNRQCVQFDCESWRFSRPGYASPGARLF